MNIKKTAALLLSTAIALSAAGCTERNPLKSSSEDRKTVMTVGTEKVRYEEYRYFWLNNKRDLYGADAVLTETEVQNIKQLVESNVTDRHALRLLADEYGIEITAEDMKRTDAYVNSFKDDCGSEEAYKEQLLEQYLNEPLFRELTQDTTIAYALLDEMGRTGGIEIGEEAYQAALMTDEVLCIKEIYISYPDESLKEWAEKRAVEVLERLGSGESFEELMRGYSNYNADDLPPEHGYYTMEYDALEEIWDAAKDLREGEYSGIVETPFGYHIIMRAPKDKAYMESRHDELYEIFRQSRFYKKFYEFRAELEVEYTGAGKKLDLFGIS